MSKQPRIFLLDIETSPLLSYNWTAYDSNALKILQPSAIICGSWKELGKDKVYCKALPDYAGYAPGDLDDRNLVQTLWTVLDTADLIITQNGEAFDLKRLNARFIYHKLNAPSAYLSVDTLKAAKKWFRFDKNNLSELGEYLGEGKKAETGGLSLWFKCMAGDKTAWTTLRLYNKQDVVLLEKIYLRLRPFISSHPNLGLIAERKDMVCASCLSANLQKRGFHYTMTGRKQRYMCNDCGSWSTGKYERMTVNIPDEEEAL